MSQVKAKKVPNKSRDKTLKKQGMNRAERRAYKNAKDANLRVHEAGMAGVDPRSDTNALPAAVQQQVQAVGSTTTLQVKATVTDRAISYLAMGIMLKALKKGSESSQENQQYPYYQFLYLVDVFTTAMQSGVIKLTAAPMWMWDLLYALKPKVCSCKNGFVEYSWVITSSGLGNDQVFNLGTGNNSYTLFWGTFPSGNSTNGFPALAPIPTAYTEQLGLASISALWPFIIERGEALFADPGPSGVSTSHDTSAFAVVYPELGESYAAEGALKTTIYSERHIDSPIFCQFAQYQPPGGTAWRGWHQARLGAGSPSMIGPYLIDNANDLQLIRNKPSPIVKFYNFDEFFEQLSITLCLAAENIFNSAGQQYVPCPLTSQQVQLLLRQTILQVCSNEYCQDIRLTGSSFVDMLPFVVGPNGTASGQSVQMQLPTFLAENIRAIGGFSAKLSKKYKTNNIQWIPILARPCEQAQLNNYSYSTNEGTQSLYATDPNEIPFNIIDVSAQIGQTVEYYDLTRTAMSDLVDLWNAWISKQTAVLSPLVVVTSEKGIKALNCNLYTNIQEKIPPTVVETPAPAPVDDKKKKRASTDRPRQLGAHLASLKKRYGTAPGPGSDYLQNVGERKITSTVGFDAALDQVISKWILPVNYSEDTLNDAGTAGWQTFQIEFASKPRSSSGGIGSGPNDAFRLPDAYQRHFQSATIDVKQFATTDQQNEIILLLQEQAKKGRGGLFSSALAAIAGSFNPTWGKMVTEYL